MHILDKFLQKYPLGTLIDYDGRYGGQCFDVVNAYIEFVTNRKPKILLLKASDIYKKPNLIIPDGVDFDKIPNTIGFVVKVRTTDNAGGNVVDQTYTLTTDIPASTTGFGYRMGLSTGTSAVASSYSLIKITGEQRFSNFNFNA